MNKYQEILFFTLLLLNTQTVFSQDTIKYDSLDYKIEIINDEIDEYKPKLEVINTSNLHYELLFSNYSDSTHRLNFRYFNYRNEILPTFFFKKKGFIPSKENVINKSYDRVIIIRGSCIFDNNFVSDTLIETDFSNADIQKTFEYFKIRVTVKKEDVQGCFDTQTYTYTIETKNGDLIFKDHNNGTFVSNKEGTEIYFVSVQSCLGLYMIYKITKE